MLECDVLGLLEVLEPTHPKRPMKYDYAMRFDGCSPMPYLKSNESRDDTLAKRLFSGTSALNDCDSLAAM